MRVAIRVVDGSRASRLVVAGAIAGPVRGPATDRNDEDRGRSALAAFEISAQLGGLLVSTRLELLLPDRTAERAARRPGPRRTHQAIVAFRRASSGLDALRAASEGPRRFFRSGGR